MQHRLLGGSREHALSSISARPNAKLAENQAHRGGHGHTAAVSGSGATVARPGRALAPAKVKRVAGGADELP